MIRAMNEKFAEDQRIRQEEARRRFVEHHELLNRQAAEAREVQARQEDAFREHLQRRLQREAESEEKRDQERAELDRAELELRGTLQQQAQDQREAYRRELEQFDRADLELRDRIQQQLEDQRQAYQQELARHHQQAEEQERRVKAIHEQTAAELQRGTAREEAIRAELREEQQIRRQQQEALGEAVRQAEATAQRANEMREQVLVQIREHREAMEKLAQDQQHAQEEMRGRESGEMRRQFEERMAGIGEFFGMERQQLQALEQQNALITQNMGQMHQMIERFQARPADPNAEQELLRQREIMEVMLRDVQSLLTAERERRRQELLDILRLREQERAEARRLRREQRHQVRVQEVEDAPVIESPRVLAIEAPAEEAPPRHRRRRREREAVHEEHEVPEETEVESEPEIQEGQVIETIQRTSDPRQIRRIANKHDRRILPTVAGRNYQIDPRNSIQITDIHYVPRQPTVRVTAQLTGTRASRVFDLRFINRPFFTPATHGEIDAEYVMQLRGLM